jgi:hypothetical protein
MKGDLTSMVSVRSGPAPGDGRSGRPESSRHRRRVLGALLAAAILPVVGLTTQATARAASIANTALILGDSVTPGVAPDGSGDSLEQYEAIQDGFTTTVVTGAQWDAMTAAQFASYQVLIIGDPTCDPSGASFAAALADETTWEPVVMSSGGNKVLIGTDPTYHYVVNGVPGDKLEGGGIAFAGAVGGSTGAYVDLSCAYDSSSAGTAVPLLDGLSTHGSGQFTVIGEGSISACATGVNIVASSGPTSGLTDADLSDWNCSVHEAFDKFPSDYTPLALAPSSSGFPSSYCADDIETGAFVCGSPYLMVSGSGVHVTSNVTLTPSSQTISACGTPSASLVANVSTNSGPVSGASVVFNVDSGPNVGRTFTGTTDSSGNVTFTYPDSGGAGTDSVSATYTDPSGATQKATATVTWTACASTPTCTLSGVSNGPPSQVVLSAQDTGSGLRKVTEPWHQNATVVVSPFTKGTTSPVTLTFTKQVETQGGSASVTATNMAGAKAYCVAFFKTVSPSRAYSQGFHFRSNRNVLVIQNAANGLTSVAIVVDGTTMHVSLTNGELYTLDMSSLLHSSPPGNTVVIEGKGPSGSSAVAVVWGSGLPA